MRRLLVFTSFLTLCILWVVWRQLSLLLLYVLGGVPKLYQAGNCDFKRLDSFMGVKDSFNSRAVFSRSRTQVGRVFALLPWVGGGHDVKEKFGFLSVKL